MRVQSDSGPNPIRQCGDCYGAGKLKPLDSEFYMRCATCMGSGLADINQVLRPTIPLNSINDGGWPD